MYPGWFGVVCVYVCVCDMWNKSAASEYGSKDFFFARKSLGRMTHNKGQLRQVLTTGPTGGVWCGQPDYNEPGIMLSTLLYTTSPAAICRSSPYTAE